MARAQFSRYEPRLDFTYLSGLSSEALEARLAALPEQSIVYYLIVYRDGEGKNFEPLAYLDRIAGVANAPTYCWVDSAMDHGIVGGSLRSQATQVDAVGATALRVLRGEAADSIPIAAVDLNARQVDWRQLRRWGISESRVPPGTRVLFREPTVLDRYRVYIVGAVALLVAQTALIAGSAPPASEASPRGRRARRKPGQAARELRADFEIWAAA